MATTKKPSTVAERAAAEQKTTRIARTTIELDGSRYEAGDEISLTGAQADQLDEVGALEPAAPATAAASDAA